MKNNIIKTLEMIIEMNWLLKSNLPDNDRLQILTSVVIYIAAQITNISLKSKIGKKIK